MAHQHIIEVLLNTDCMLYCSQSTPMANGLKRTWNGQYQQYVREICDSADLLQRCLLYTSDAADE